MLTEQEAAAQLNNKVSSGEIKPSTKRLLEKIAVLQSRLTTQQTELVKIREMDNKSNIEIQRLKGAISVLLELAAEEEGMIESTETARESA